MKKIFVAKSTVFYLTHQGELFFLGNDLYQANLIDSNDSLSQLSYFKQIKLIDQNDESISNVSIYNDLMILISDKGRTFYLEI